MAKNTSKQLQTILNTVADYRIKAETINPFYPEMEAIHTDLYDHYNEKEGCQVAEQKYEEALSTYEQLANAISNLSAFYRDNDKYDLAEDEENEDEENDFRPNIAAIKNRLAGNYFEWYCALSEENYRREW